ncbi:MAG: prepilin-type N-terminal cleavage/methylation domain-containing protein [Gemmatimonadetes bacterium]|nr:prepilin-type N-terminal cleavage/methylation domain-containing protein [Gemmatimonadota bacterium]
MPARRGFSIIELLTALTLLAVGLAASTRAASAVARLDGDARLRQAMAATLTARLDSVRGLACGAAQAGVATHFGVVERWAVSPAPRHYQLLDSIDVPSRPRLAHAVQAAVPCRP